MDEVLGDARVTARYLNQPAVTLGYRVEAGGASAEYPSKIGWGHTAAELAVEMAIEGDVKRLALFHHDPGRDDQALSALELTCRIRATDIGGIGTALEVANTVQLDLMLLDWLMPGTDGLDVCRALRADSDAHLRDLPVVLLTGLTSSEETGEAFAAGATDYLTKPFGMAHVRARVHEWLLRGDRGSDQAETGQAATGQLAGASPMKVVM